MEPSAPSEHEQRLFARLSVFAGGCTLEAAEEVAEADLDAVQSLVEKSLLRVTDERYWMLETIRDLGLERISRSGEYDEIRVRHAARHARLAIELMTPLREYSAEALATAEQEQDNMRAALGFSLDRDEVVVASDLMAGLWFYWLEYRAVVRRHVAGRFGIWPPPARRCIRSSGSRVISAPARSCASQATPRLGRRSTASSWR